MKAFLILFLMIFMISCTDVDESVSLVIGVYQKNLVDLNKIKKITKDSTVINFIDSTKCKKLQEAYTISEFLDEKSDMFTSLSKSKEQIKIYIDSLKIK